jgi:hypothetical protein
MLVVKLINTNVSAHRKQLSDDAHVTTDQS